MKQKHRTCRPENQQIEAVVVGKYAFAIESFINICYPFDIIARNVVGQQDQWPPPPLQLVCHWLQWGWLQVKSYGFQIWRVDLPLCVLCYAQRRCRPPSSPAWRSCKTYFQFGIILNLNILLSLFSPILYDEMVKWNYFHSPLHSQMFFEIL